jgi:ABC-type amino acid transport substrate-binding protein
MKSLALSALALALTLTACGGAKTSTYVASLSSANEVPPVTTVTATGTATLVLDEDTKVATLTGSVTGLSGDLTMAHIHGSAAAGANAGVLFTLEPKNDTANKSATIKDAPTAAMAKITLTDDQITELKAGKFYVNVHTAANPGGEARGQLLK